MCVHLHPFRAPRFFSPREEKKRVQRAEPAGRMRDETKQSVRQRGWCWHDEQLCKNTEVGVRACGHAARGNGTHICARRKF